MDHSSCLKSWPYTHHILYIRIFICVTLCSIVCMETYGPYTVSPFNFPDLYLNLHVEQSHGSLVVKNTTQSVIYFHSPCIGRTNAGSRVTIQITDALDHTTMYIDHSNTTIDIVHVNYFEDLNLAGAALKIVLQNGHVELSSNYNLDNGFADFIVYNESHDALTYYHKIPYASLSHVRTMMQFQFQTTGDANTVMKCPPLTTLIDGLCYGYMFQCKTYDEAFEHCDNHDATFPLLNQHTLEQLAASERIGNWQIKDGTHIWSGVLRTNSTFKIANGSAVSESDLIDYMNTSQPLPIVNGSCYTIQVGNAYTLTPRDCDGKYFYVCRIGQGFYDDISSLSLTNWGATIMGRCGEPPVPATEEVMTSTTTIYAQTTTNSTIKAETIALSTTEAEATTQSTAESETIAQSTTGAEATTQSTTETETIAQSTMEAEATTATTSRLNLITSNPTTNTEEQSTITTELSHEFLTTNRLSAETNRYGPFFFRPKLHADKFVSLAYSHKEEQGYLEVSNRNDTVFFIVYPALLNPNFANANVEVVKYLNDSTGMIGNITTYIAYVAGDDNSVITKTNGFSKLRVGRSSSADDVYFKRWVNQNVSQYVHYNMTANTNLTYYTVNLTADGEPKTPPWQLAKFITEFADETIATYQTCPLDMENIANTCNLFMRDYCLNVTEAAKACMGLGYPGAEMAFMDSDTQSKIMNNKNLPFNGRYSYWNVQLNRSSVFNNYSHAEDECLVIKDGSPVFKRCSERTRFYCKIDKGPYMDISKWSVLDHFPFYWNNDYDEDCNLLSGLLEATPESTEYNIAASMNELSTDYNTATTTSQLSADYNIATSNNELSTDYNTATTTSQLSADYNIATTTNELSTDYNSATSTNELSTDYNIATTINILSTDNNIATSTSESSTEYDIATTNNELSTEYNIATSINELSTNYNTATTTSELPTDYNIATSNNELSSEYKSTTSTNKSSTEYVIATTNNELSTEYNIAASINELSTDYNTATTSSELSTDYNIATTTNELSTDYNSATSSNELSTDYIIATTTNELSTDYNISTSTNELSTDYDTVHQTKEEVRNHFNTVITEKPRTDALNSSSPTAKVTYRRAKKVVFPVEEAFAAPVIGTLPLLVVVVLVSGIVMLDFSRILKDMRRASRNVKRVLKKL
ncbi:unnamed protein product [Owenia fusiformis]|uniref:C-type lectin domain-containing protein n=1 Tax=Owenia fusiformis TaxID=6347 RepID=A0A8S4N6K2_OWEFU|nr:unnamed protein product [Owenia fusiformis]